MSHIEKIDQNLYCIGVDPFPDFIKSYVLILDNEAVLIETGPVAGSDSLLIKLEELKIIDKIKYVIVTHIHLDHGGGMGKILRNIKNAIGIVHPRAVKHLINPKKLWYASKESLGWLAELYGEPEPAPKDKLMGVKDGYEIKIGKSQLKIIHTVGHASHHISVYDKSSETLFVGDSAGIYLKEFNMIIPTTMPPFILDYYLKSIDKQVALKPKRLAYTHTGMLNKNYNTLIEYKTTVLKWLDYLIECVKAGIEDPIKCISFRDEKVKKLVNVLNERQHLKLLLDLSLKGLVEEAIKISGSQNI